MKKRRRRLKKLKKSILKDIAKIKITIHRFGLSGTYIWPALDRKIGKLKLNDKYRPSERRSNYRKHAFVRFRKRNLTVFLNPIEGAFPQCVIEMSYPYQKLLSKLRSKLPDLKVSFAEYTIDIYFENPEDVRKYFALIYRYIYLPYQKEMVLHSDKKLDDITRDKNAWVYTKNMRLKLYERGPDNKTGYWLLDDVDRIRIEFRATWGDLNRYGLTDLKLFSKNPKFYLMLKDRFRFKRFKESANNLPSEYEAYSAKDSQGHSGSFHNQFLYLKKRNAVKNISQSTEDVPELRALYARIFDKIIRREENWEKKYREVNWKEVEKAEKFKKKTGWETTISIEEAKHLGLKTSVKPNKS